MPKFSAQSEEKFVLLGKSDRKKLEGGGRDDKF